MRQRQVEYAGSGAEQDQRDVEQIGIVPDRIAENPGEMLGQKDGFDQNDDGQGKFRDVPKEAARKSPPIKLAM